MTGFDFGGDAADNKCQVRVNGNECHNKVRFLFYQNSFTMRGVCGDCLPEALERVCKGNIRGLTVYLRSMM